MQIIERNNKRVLTTAQIAEGFGTDYKVISQNFSRNRDRYTEGVHYFFLQGDERKDFLFNNPQNDDSSKHAKFIYLWTEKGVFLHAKSLNTDQAWSAYTKLVDDYFKKVEELKQMQPELSAFSPQLQFMIITEQRQNELEAKQVVLEDNVRTLKLVVDNEVWITEHQKSDIKEAVKSRVGRLKSKAIDAHFQGCYGDLNTYFGVAKYDKIARKDFEQAMEFIQGWFPKKKENLS